MSLEVTLVVVLQLVHFTRAVCLGVASCKIFVTRFYEGEHLCQSKYVVINTWVLVNLHTYKPVEIIIIICICKAMYIQKNVRSETRNIHCNTHTYLRYS